MSLQLQCQSRQFREYKTPATLGQASEHHWSTFPQESAGEWEGSLEERNEPGFHGENCCLLWMSLACWCQLLQVSSSFPQTPEG